MLCWVRAFGVLASVLICAAVDGAIGERIGSDRVVLGPHFYQVVPSQMTLAQLASSVAPQVLTAPNLVSSEPIAPKEQHAFKARLVLQNISDGLMLVLHAPLAPLLVSGRAVEVMDHLRHPEKLWMLPPSAQCTAGAPMVQSERLSKLLERQVPLSRQRENRSRVPGSLPREEQSPELNTDDVKVTYVYRCANSARLDGMQVKLMQVFPAIKHVEINLAGTTRKIVNNDSPEVGRIQQIKLVSP